MRLDFRIKYKKGKDNVVTNVLSRNPTQFKSASVFVITSELIQRVNDSCRVDHKLQKFIDSIRMNQNPRKYYTFENDVLRRKAKLVVGNNAKLRTQILQPFHDSAIGGHSGYEMTYRRIKDHFYWMGMPKVVKKWVQNCHICKKLSAMLQLLYIPDRP